MIIDTNKLANILAESIADNIKNEINTSVEFKDGKAIVNINVNKDYLRGVEDTIDSLSRIDMDSLL